MSNEHGMLTVVNSGKYAEWMWKIQNFSLSEICYLSPTFMFESEYWQLLFYTHGGSGSNVYYGLNVRSTLLNSPTRLEFTGAFKTTEGTENFERRGSICFMGEQLYYEIMQCISKSEFINRQREFLSSGCLTILITMKKADSGESESESDALQPSAFQPKNKIAQDFKQMFLNQENYDVVLRVQDKEFKAHKVILMARSPVFASMFRSNMKETVTGTVDIDDVDPSCFPEFLCFLYCGETDNLSTENVCSLFTAADKYGITDLRAMCVEFMIKNLSADVFCETLTFSLFHSELYLINACEDFFVKNAGEITETDKWESFVDENPKQTNKLYKKYVKLTSHTKSRWS